MSRAVLDTTWELCGSLPSWKVAGTKEECEDSFRAELNARDDRSRALDGGKTL
jgi:hypothetical protein